MKPLDESIFRANDIRGVVNAGLDARAAGCIGRACGDMARARGFSQIAVGRDGRHSGPELSAALAAGLAAAGVQAADLGLAPTPAVYHAAVSRFAGCGAVVTGSHNPKRHNGMKIMLGGAMLSGDAMRELQKRAVRFSQSRQDSDFESSGPQTKTGSGPQTKTESESGSETQTESDSKTKPFRIPEALDEYACAVAAAVGPLPRRLKIVLDAGNGAAGACAPRIFRALNCEVVELFCDIDGDFPNHHPDPARPENLRDAVRVMAETGADAAFIFDGDGDRLGAALPGTGAVFADRLLMLFARDLLSRRPGARVVYDVKCTSRLAPWVERFGGVADMQPTGHAFIKARMRETGALLGGEMSGHFYFKEDWFGFDDALFAGARLAAIFAAAESPAAAMARVPALLATPELNASRPLGDQRKFMEKFRRTAEFPGALRVVEIDGMRVEYADGFGLARASNTTSSLVFRFEGADEDALARIQSDFRRALRSADPEMALPF